jgi:hypothetical protein
VIESDSEEVVRRAVSEPFSPEMIKKLGNAKGIMEDMAH